MIYLVTEKTLILIKNLLFTGFDIPTNQTSATSSNP
jgi:hypothetical protein